MCPALPPFPALSAACVQAATSKDASKDAASASSEPEPVFEDLEARVFYEALPDVRSLVPAVLLGDVEPVAPVAPAAAAEVGQRTASPVTCHAHNRCWCHFSNGCTLRSLSFPAGQAWVDARSSRCDQRRPGMHACMPGAALHWG